MFPGPVFFHELRAAARRRRSYALRFGLGLLLFYLVIAPVSSYRYYRPEAEFLPSELAELGAWLFLGVLWVQGIVILVLTPAFVAGSIAEDRQRKVLLYLLASPLSSAEIVVGKLAARLITLTVLVLSALPVVSIALFLGGVDPLELWLWFAAGLSILYFLAGVSLCVSAYAERPREAIVRAYLLELGWLALPLVLRLGDWQPWMLTVQPVTQWLTDSSLTELAFSGSSPVFPDRIGRMIILQVVYGTLLLAWTTMRLRALERGSARSAGRWPGLSGVLGPVQIAGRRACGDHPMLWKECSGSWRFRSGLSAAALIALALVLAGGIVYWLAVWAVPAFGEVCEYGYGAFGSSGARSDLNTSIRILTGVLYVLAGLLVGAAACTSITSERERDTWTSLIATPLEGVEILQAKMLGSAWRLLGAFAALFMTWVVGLVCGALHPLGLLAVALTTSVNLAFIIALGTYVSLRARSSVRAVAATVGILLFMNGGYLLCCLPGLFLGSNGFVHAAGVSPIWVVSAAASYDDIDRLIDSQPPMLGWTLEFVGAGIVSVGLYSVLAFMLYFLCLKQFDREVDRPRRLLELLAHVPGPPPPDDPEEDREEIMVIEDGGGSEPEPEPEPERERPDG